MTDYLHSIDDVIYWNADAEQECNLRAQEQSRPLYVLAIREYFRYHNERMQAKVLKQSIGLGGLKYEKSERAENPAVVVDQRQDEAYRARRSLWDIVTRYGIIGRKR